MKHKIEQRIDSILGLEREYKNYYTYFFDQVRWLKEEIKNQEFKITIIGEFSAGKSTFINALIGKDILPHATNETTSTVTYIHNVDKEHPYYEKAIIKFSGQDTPEVKIDLKEDGLKNYVTTFSTKYHVAKEIQSVHVYTSFTHTKEKVVLVDTPGLNGMADGHKELTLKEIREGHASIFLFHLRNLTSSNQELIRYACEQQPKILFVLNFIDELRRSEGETVEGKLAELKMQIQKYLPDAIKQREIECFGISALRALAGRDESIKRIYQTDIKDLEASDRARLLQDSQIEIFEKALWQELINSQKDAIFYEAIGGKLDELIADVLQEITISEKVQLAKLDKNAIAQIQIHLQEIQIQRAKNWEIVNNLILSKQRELSKLISTQLYKDLQGVQAKFEQNIEQMDGDLFEDSLKQQKFTPYIKSQVNTVEEKFVHILHELLQDVYQSAIMRTKSFRPEIKLNVNGEFKLQYTAQKVDIKDSEDLITKKQNAISELQASFNTLQAQINMERVEIAKKQRELDVANQSTEQDKARLKRELEGLGSRPGVDYRTVTKERRVKRGAVTGFFSKLFGGDGYRTETYTVEEKDYSRQERWDANHRQLTQRLQSIEKQNDALKQRLKQLQSSNQMNNERFKDYEKRLQENKRELEILRKEQEERKKHARREYLRAEKNKVYKKSRENIEKYQVQLQNNIDKMISLNINQIQNLVKKYYDEMQKQHEIKLRQLLGEKTQQATDIELQRFKRAIEQVQKGTIASNVKLTNKNTKKKQKLSSKLAKK